MNDEQVNAEKDFRGLIGSMNNFGEIRLKMICEIDDILDRIKQNRKLSPEQKQATTMIKEPEDVITQLSTIVRHIDCDNERLARIISRLNELI